MKNLKGDNALENEPRAENDSNEIGLLYRNRTTGRLETLKKIYPII
jgi:hypothetical protein